MELIEVINRPCLLLWEHGCRGQPSPHSCKFCDAVLKRPCRVISLYTCQKNTHSAVSYTSQLPNHTYTPLGGVCMCSQWEKGSEPMPDTSSSSLQYPLKEQRIGHSHRDLPLGEILVIPPHIIWVSRSSRTFYCSAWLSCKSHSQYMHTLQI